MKSNRGPCRHCGRVMSLLARRLCWKCFHTPAVRELYPPSAPYGTRGLGNEPVTRRPPAAPTAARVGTLDRLREYRRRLVAGEHLFHPADTREVGAPKELEDAQLACFLACLAAAPDPLAA